MDAQRKAFSEVVSIFKSWISKTSQSEPANESKVYWMPDKTCTVCYGCNCPFTLFNRRHHCRHCGQIFCAHCTANSVPAPSSDQRTRLRLCRLCYKQWEQGLASCNNNNHVPNLDHSQSLSVSSFTSSKCIATANSSNNSVCSLPVSIDCYQQDMSLRRSSVKIKGLDREILSELRRDLAASLRDSSLNQCEYSMERSGGDDEDDYGVYRSASEMPHYSGVSAYYGHADFDYGINNFDGSQLHADVLRNSLETQYFDMQGLDGSEVSSSLYGSADIDAEPLDFENNGLLWLPPEPEEDEEYEQEDMLFDDDDDDYGNDIGEWGYAHSPSSLGSVESRNRDRSCEEQAITTSNVVDEHFRALVAQLLQVENLPIEENDGNSWFEIITSLSWEAATLLKPDTSQGGGMDPCGYVKVKCIACGNRNESVVVKGVVCKKNVAHRRMKSKVDRPRLLILGGALDYQRVTNQLTSVNTLLQQEMEHLKVAVAKIAAEQPDILLVEKSVSRYAQEYLLAQGISLVLNVKMPLLERIARCTETQIAPSVDHLSSLKLGICETFRVEKIVEDLVGQGAKKTTKTLMFFDGCPKPLGFTILLRGADKNELKRVKQVVKYGVFAAYYLAVETSFFADEGASQPELQGDKIISIADLASFVGGKEISSTCGPYTSSMPPPATSNSHPTTFYPSPNPSLNLVSYNEKPLASEDIDKMESKTSLEIMDLNDPSPSVNDCWTSDKFDHGILSDTPQDSHSQMSIKLSALELPPIGVGQSSKLETEAVNEEQLLGEEQFPPSPHDHQSILVSMSSRCVWKGTMCEKPHIFRIQYYRNLDKPLGRFLLEYLFDQNYQCNFCEMPSEAHVHSYTHRQGTISISVKKLPETFLPGEKDGKIWMWHRCLKCPRMNGFPPATHRIIMSDAAWGLSFGKFLELSFANHAAASRVAGCGHSLHRDCLRFYGYGNMVACFRYASIEINSVYLPPYKLDFDGGNQEWIQKESDEVANRAKLLFSEVLTALRQIEDKRASSMAVNSSGLATSESGKQVAELQRMLRREKDEFEEALHKILNQEKRKDQPGVDILEINRLRRQLFFQSYMWDHRLIYAASSANLSNKSDLFSNSNTDDKARSMSENLKRGMSVSGAFSSILTNSKLMEGPEPGLSKISQADDDMIFDQDIDRNIKDNEHEKEDHPSHDPSTKLVGLGIRRSLSEGHYYSLPCLHDTLDAKWTGDERSGFVTPKDNNKSENLDEFMADSLSNAIQRGISNHPEDQNVLKNMTIKGRDHYMEDSLSWLKMPFINFYRSFNKNFHATAQEFDTLADHNPVYVSSFREMELQGEARLLLPIGVNDTVIPVFDDEPSSIISYALMSTEYHAQLNEVETMPSLYLSDSSSFPSFISTDETSFDPQKSFFSGTDDTVPSFSPSRSSRSGDPLVCTKAMHPRVSFGDGGPRSKVQYAVTVYYAKRFDAMRRVCCPSELDYVRSLSRCKKWGAQGGKSNVFFAKTMDDRLIVKQVTKTELESFIKFGPAYFKYISDSIGSAGPTCLAKILGMYQVTVKHPKGATSKESKIDVLVMENLLFKRNVVRLYDLKGSSRSRYNSDSTGTNKVLLDQNLIESIPTSPIFVGNKAKRLLLRAVWNDTNFLAKVGVMDYSLLLGIDQENHKLVIGIIDYMRQYTWDKHLETWVKASGILGGPKNAAPTVISPLQYKKRFRKAMSGYFYMLPDQWSVPPVPTSKSQSDSFEDNTQSTSVE